MPTIMTTLMYRQLQKCSAYAITIFTENKHTNYPFGEIF